MTSVVHCAMTVGSLIGLDDLGREGGSHNAADRSSSSTARYRLQRIREVTGADLNDADTRFNLQVRRAPGG